MDGPPPPEEDFSQIPISERLKHKNWKARLSAYEQLPKSFKATGSETDPVFKPYIADSDLLKSMVTDSNAVAQEKGVECVISFVKYAGETAAKTREAVVPALVEKCLGSARAGTRTHSIELILQYAEVENTGAGVATDVLSGLGAKQPKAVANTVLVLKELVRAFGTQVIQPQKILKALPKIFGHSDKTVRAEGAALVQCLYQAIGPAIDPFLGELKPVQVKELHETFEAMEKEGKGKNTLKPERLTRQQAREVEQAALAGEDPSISGIAATVEEPEPDPRMFSEEVDVIPKLPSGYSTSLSSSKWKERKEALDEIFAAVNTLRIKDSPELSDLIKTLAGRMSDANINCVIVAANCIESLAKGLLKAFARHRETVVPPLLGRLKERKQNVTDALGLALDAVFLTTNLPDILGDIQPFLADKNPQIKEGTLKFLHRSLQKATTPPSAPQVKPLSESLAVLSGDSVGSVRDDAALALGTLMKIVGERPLNPVIEPLDASRKAKIKEAFDQAVVRCKTGASAPKPPPVAVAKESPVVSKKKPQSAPKKVVEEQDAEESISLPTTATADAFEEDPPAKPRAKPPARLLAKKTPVSAPPSEPASAGGPAKKPSPASAAAASKSAKPSPPAPPGALDTFKYKYTSEDAEVLASSLIPDDITTGFSDANWKARLAAVEEMSTWLEGIIADVDSEVIVRYVAKKGWNEKNFQVSAKLYAILSMLAEKCPSFGRSSAALCIGHLSEKLGDMKLKKPAGDTLLLLAEKSSLSFVLNQAYDPLGKQKAPKVLADAITWINQALTEFGIAGLSLRNLIEFLKTSLKNSNAAVRSSATTALVTVKLFAGSGIKDLLEDLNPQLITTIHAEFDKVEGQNPPSPTRISADLASLPQTTEGGKNKIVADPLDDLFPRVDLDKLLVGTSILADTKNDAWKSRKDGLEALQGLLDAGANKRLKPTMGDIGQVLKARLTDTNKAVQLLALDVVGRIATGMNKPFEKHTRLFVVPLTAALSDQKNHIRAAALQTLTAIANACEGIDSMIPGLATGMESQNPVQRASILNWISTWYKNNDSTPDHDLQPWAPHVVCCLEDRNGDVRKGAQAVLPIIIKSIGVDKVLKETSSLKPASRSTVIPLIQAAKTAMPDKPPAISTSSVTPVVTSGIKPEPLVIKTEQPIEAVRQSPSPQSAAPAAYGNGRLTGVRSKKIQPNIVRPDSQSSIRDEENAASGQVPKLGVGLKRPAGTLSSKTTASVSSPTTSFYFNGSSLESKKLRLSKDSSRWIFDSNAARKDSSELLQHQMEGHLSRDLISLLFSTSHNTLTDNISGLDIIVNCFVSVLAGEENYGLPVSEMQNILIANSDLPLKYTSMKVHEPQPNLISKCLDVVDNVLSLLRAANHQLSDAEALCFVPTLIHKLGDAREVVRIRVGQIIQTLPKVYAYSRLFQLLLEHGLKSKVAKTRQGTLEELENILKRAGIGVCEPSKSMPILASMISDKDPYVRKAALSTLSESYILIGDKIWNMVGMLSPKDKTQLEERLRRTPLPEIKDSAKPSAIKPPTSFSNTQSSSVSALPAVIEPPRSMSPSGLPRVSKTLNVRPASPSSLYNDNLPKPSVVPTRPKSMLPSRLGPNRIRPNTSTSVPDDQNTALTDRRALQPLNGTTPTETAVKSPETSEAPIPAIDNSVTVIISSILSHDPSRSVDALKRIQKILEVSPEEAHLSNSYVELSEHVEGLVETVALQMGHVFENPETVYEPESFRLAKHLNQTLNAFCDHPLLAEALSVDTVTGLLDELTLRLLQTDDSNDSKVKDLSRFINMIILRLFATCRRIVIFRALFRLLLQIVRPFPSDNTQANSQEAKVAELVLKCVWKLARNIPSDLSKQLLDPIELFPAIEYFLQSIPPNEWRARATNKVPAGDMPLRTIKVIVQHIVAQYGDEVYEKLSAAFEDPSATIVYPYVYRILNSNPPNPLNIPIRSTEEPPARVRTITNASETTAPQYLETIRQSTPVLTTHTPSGAQSARSSQYSIESDGHRSTGSSPQRTERPSLSVDDDDPDAQLIKIISNISSETTGALHKEGITQLHKFLKAYPHKKPRVDKLLDSTGPAFRKYIARALASRAAEDDEREVAVADTLSRLEAVRQDVPRSPMSTGSSSPRRLSVVSDAEDTKLSRLHDLFGYHGRAATRSSAGSANSNPAINQRISGTVDADGTLKPA